MEDLLKTTVFIQTTWRTIWRRTNHAWMQKECLCIADSYSLSSWALTSCQPRNINPGWITFSFKSSHQDKGHQIMWTKTGSQFQTQHNLNIYSLIFITTNKRRLREKCRITFSESIWKYFLWSPLDLSTGSRIKISYKAHVAQKVSVPIVVTQLTRCEAWSVNFPRKLFGCFLQTPQWQFLHKVDQALKHVTALLLVVWNMGQSQTQKVTQQFMLSNLQIFNSLPADRGSCRLLFTCWSWILQTTLYLLIMDPADYSLPADHGSCRLLFTCWSWILQTTLPIPSFTLHSAKIQILCLPAKILPGGRSPSPNTQQ